ncbi:MAG: excinuclease ABC subunit UvrA [Clostridiales bacterium]|nr:excinuclease ABC subunit UvrA [Clostridiales bacterium]
MAKSKNIVIKGAREHNLKNIDLEIPRDSMVVFTGLSGSGKSSLAFDTIYAEGQRRYVESLSSYARQFLGQLEKPDVDYIEGLSPAISIDQKTTSKNPRSTVGTVTEIYDYLRLLWARIGTPHCPICGRVIEKQTVDCIADKIMAYPAGTKIQIMAPVVRSRKGEYAKELRDIARSGFVRVRIDSIIYDLSEEIKLDKNKKHNIEVVVDRLVVSSSIESRLADSIETATHLSGGLVLCDIVGGGEELFSLEYACPEHGVSIEEMSPRMFSFNNPYGACKRCSGLGTFMKIDEELIIPNRKLSINQGAVKASGWNAADGSSIARMYYEALAREYNFSLDMPVEMLPKKAVDAILHGTGGKKLKMQRVTSYGSGTYMKEFEGIVENLRRRYEETTSDWAKADIESVMVSCPCPDCGGARLSPVSMGVTVGGKNIYEFCKMSVRDELDFINNLELSEREQAIGNLIIREIRERLNFLNAVGLSYLTLSRTAATLSGGEAQRIRLATQIGSSLTGVLYILDEPSIGLHQRDNKKLLETLYHLRDLGNTLIVVEHDEETILSADYVVDIGPGAGVHGGQLVAAGSVNDIMKCKQSITGQYLSGEKRIPVPAERRRAGVRRLTVSGARENNLKNITVSIPLGCFTAVTGVSGSGKSSLVNEILYKYLANKLNHAKKRPGDFDKIKGAEHLDKVIDIDQSPIGRTPRSNPATYTGVFNDIRDLFSETADAKVRGYKANRFSFNVKGGRCEACMGDGIVKIEMHFLADVYVPCEVCGGRRYNRETLEVKFKGKNIYDVLEMTIDEGIKFFEQQPKIYRKLQTLSDVGLGYIKIGQPATTLSGGEAQRVKLATELMKRPTGKTIYILDEPTTGLHTADVHRLINVLQALVDGGNSIVVIEHNLDVIKTADYIIDLGPEGGDEGGTVVAAGTPEEVARCADSYTGQYLKEIL